MRNFYFVGVLLTAGTATAQTASLPATAIPSDTLRPHFRGTWPDSLAAAPTPGGTFRLQGQDQPARPFLTIQDQLRTVAGVQVTPYDGSPGSGNVVRIRGASVASGLAQPLYVIDGLPALNDDLTPGQSYGLTAPMAPYEPSGTYPYQATIADRNAEAGASPMQLLPPDAIASIEVLAGPAAVARYGPLAANGVVSIRTRTGRADRPLRVRYAAYLGLQQVRQRYDLLNATQYAQLANEVILNAGLPTVPFTNTNLGSGTDWQAETYRNAGVQQHQISLEGGRDKTAFLLSLDYRKQNGVLQHADLTRLGLRLALDQRVGQRLHLRGTAALGQSTQQLPYTTGSAGATRAALLAPPTQPVRNSDGAYSGYGNPSSYGPALALTNPVAVADYAYRTPRTRRLLTQLAADYNVLPHLTVHAAANFQRTLLSAESSRLYTFYTANTFTPPTGQNYATQLYRTSQWGAQVAVRYQQQLGLRHAIGAEIDYQYQGTDLIGRTDYLFQNGSFGYNGGYYEQTAELRLHRPWASLHYSLDSALTVETGLSYAHYRNADRTEYFPNAQLSWQAHSGQPTTLRLWLGAARTSTLGANYPLFGPAQLISPFGYGTLPRSRVQSPLYVDQLETGLHLGRRYGRLTGQLVVYQRTSYHALLSQLVPISFSSGNYTYFMAYEEATIRNQGLELTLAADWQHGRLQGTTRLVGSLNRNRLREQQDISSFSPAFDNQPVGTFYGYQQDGLDANGARRFVQASNGGNAYLAQSVLGSGIPAQLASLSQQLRLSRLALDAQLDGMFGYRVLNQQLDLLDTPTGFNNSATSVNDRWTRTHQNTTIPAAGARSNDPSTQSNPMGTTDRLLENGANVRLSSLTLTYRLRQTETQDISVWVGGQNLFVLTGYRGYDPNVSSGGATPTYAGVDYGAVPVPRTWLLGVKAEF
ncbi:TonB-dependent receptor plug domain-containing protein [Hymenobacter negativus]|uniref:TonB-dependent receptor plug domain-containing protein n=1 Tax=Hymenobacter negativus TaxID=2795026 RepID=A0ABS3QGS7_9BACT|nr:TonB-dependent receptor plug domain-containing protein [Hymenobacter negativus]MBO2010453.1 TonB-dependent receptor plug domain-containing protein [Hymenobacter negativus]